MTSLVAFLFARIFRPSILTRRNKHNLPLPKICHKEITDSDICNRAVFVIGDVHGCCEEMCELIDKAKEVEKDILFIFVGDLVNKGPNSVGVIRTIRNMGNSAFSVRGNHDESALREIRNLERDPDNYEPPKQYSWIRNLNTEDINYLSELPYTISLPSLHAIIVHAGLVPGKPLEIQHLNDMTNMRNVVEEYDHFHGKKLIGYRHTDKGVAWIEAWPGPDQVYFGHDARRLLQRSEYATGLDTGCVYGGHMSGVFINKSRTLLTVKSRQKCNWS
ncbi:hypothetical protein ACF0H5_016741 [Mactra antiquata]